MPVTLTRSDYGVLPDGRRSTQYVLSNTRGVRVSLLDFGATLAAVEIPDRDGKILDVTHGYDRLQSWVDDTTYFGATIGRFANRIAHGKFSLDGKVFTLATNNVPGGVPCHLHGGLVGFNKKVWSGREVERPGAKGVEFSVTSPAGDEGYPGNLEVTLIYWLTDHDELTLEFSATADEATVVNLTNHTYWNLSGDPHRPIADHVVQLDCDRMLPVNTGLIPTGKLAAVKGTPFDFTRPEKIGARIGADDQQLRHGNGYDHCWVVNGDSGLRRAARVVDPESGRTLELWTDQPGMQLYTGNFLDGGAKGKGGVSYAYRTAFCLEPQRFPDAPNQPDFPSAVLRPGETYRHTLQYRFSVSR